MTHPTNWPNPDRPGVPLFSERDGWHVIDDDCLFWRAEESAYAVNSFVKPSIPSDRKKKNTYCGILLSPTQIAELLAAERERCVQEALHIGEGWNGTELSPSNTARHIAQAIRNLGAAP